MKEEKEQNNGLPKKLFMEKKVRRKPLDACATAGFIFLVRNKGKSYLDC